MALLISYLRTCLFISCLAAFADGLPVIRDDGFSLASETAKSSFLEETTPVEDRDHWNCHQNKIMPIDALQRSTRIAVLVPFREQDGHKRREELTRIIKDIAWRSNDTAVAHGSELRFFVAEQTKGGSFNRGALLNVAFDRAQQYYEGQDFTVVTQDCDLVPDDAMLKWYFAYGEGPLHLTSYIYCPSLGGVAVFRRDQYKAINGFSNEMWGWGAEDDDAMDRWMAGPSRDVIVPGRGERFNNLGVSFDRKRDKRHYDESMKVWRLDNGQQEWVENGLSSLQYDLIDIVRESMPRVEHVKVDLSKLRSRLTAFLQR